MAGSDSVDWQQLVSQTQTLVTEGNGYQRVQRDLHQLQRMADLQRARTTRMRTADNTLAATRLLVAQGLDSQQLLQEGQALQLQPMNEDTYQAPQPTDVAEFLAKVCLAPAAPPQQHLVHPEVCSGHASLHYTLSKALGTPRSVKHMETHDKPMVAVHTLPREAWAVLPGHHQTDLAASPAYRPWSPTGTAGRAPVSHGEAGGGGLR